MLDNFDKIHSVVVQRLKQCTIDTEHSLDRIASETRREFRHLKYEYAKPEDKDYYADPRSLVVWGSDVN